MNEEAKIQKGAFPVTIQRTLRKQSGAAEDLTDATSVALKATSPSGVIKTFTGAFVSPRSSGKVRYITAAATDLDEVGDWMFQFVVGYPDDGSIACYPFSIGVAENL